MTLVVTIVLAGLSIGINAMIWGTAGCVRLLADRRHGGHRERGISREEIGLVCAARNEESVIQGMLSSVRALLPLDQAYVVSDGSSDRTAELARRAGANVLELSDNLGKARALATGVRHFELCQKYSVVIVVDADTELSADYLDSGLLLFADPSVAAVAGMAHTMWRPSELSRVGRLVVSYRERLYLYTQYMFKYGQGWANAVTVAPGFASMYRSRALQKLPIDAPGLVIEDFNMTFEIHRQRLGRVAFHPRAAVAFTQDPDNFRDYRRQVGRWALGYWQSVRRFLRRPGWFELSLVLLSVEIASSYLVFVLAPLAILLWAVAELVVVAGAGPDSLAAEVVRADIWLRVLLAMLVPDLLVSLVAAAGQRRLTYLKWAFVFPLLHVVDAWVGVRSLLRAVTARSSGVWISPARRGRAGGQVLPASPAALFKARGRSFAAYGGLAGVSLAAILAILTSAYGAHTRQLRVSCVIPHSAAVSTAESLASAQERRAVQTVLKRTPYISMGQPRKREVALTFDDGPGPFTPQVLPVLERMHVQATFFVVGREVRSYPSYLANELAGGFVIGDHTEDHSLLPALSAATQQAQIRQQVAAIKTCGAPYPYLFRPPYGGFNAATLEVLRRSGMLMVLWSVNTRDYTRPGVRTIVRRALAGAKPGAIILMHDGDPNRTQTVAALPAIIAGIRARHLLPVTIPQLLIDDPPDPRQPPPQSLSGALVAVSSTDKSSH